VANRCGVQGQGSRAVALAAAWLVCALAPAAPQAPPPQQQVPDGTPIRRVEFKGLQAISEAYVRRVVKTREGQNLSIRQVEQDVRELLRTRKFVNVFAEPPRLEDNQAVVVFVVQEKPRLATVEIEGNKSIPTADLLPLVPAAGDVLDVYAVNKGRDDIVQKYKEKGYYYVDVQVDERLLREESRAVYRINEGPRVRVRKILFEGVRSVPEATLRRQIETKTYIWIFRTGEFDEEKADRDALTLQQYYRDEGFLDARVGYRLEFDPISRSDLTIVFVVEEGLRYRVGRIEIEGNTVFDRERILEKLNLTPGKFVRREVLDADRQRVRDMYGELGYVDVRVETRIDFTDEPGVVVLRYIVDEGAPSRIGRITIRGNERTKDEVIRRELRFYPGEEFNTIKMRKAEQRIRETRLFVPDKVRITPLKDVEGVREALVEVQEADTVQFLIGVGVSTDNGVIGTLSIENRNFDLFDWPRNREQFFRGQAFRGDGQRAKISLEPGTEVSRFRIDFTEPYLFDLPLRYDQSFYLFQRARSGYDEQRLGLLSSLSRRFESGPLADWALEGTFRLEGVKISDVDPLAASDIKDVKGDSTLTSLKAAIVRDTTDSRIVPTQGYRMVFSWEQVGAVGGDYSFGKPSLDLTWYKTLRTDILDRKSVLALRLDAAYIVGDAPVFERFYAGGFGSIRGFQYRGISPRGGIEENPIGGDFLLLTGGEYSFPLYGKSIRGVTFVDMGTVEEDFELSGWRVAVGFGLRIQVDFFGPVPIVLDFGFPVAKEEDDDTQVFNFAFGASF
jgi:outer membrane protein insertion porin family